MDFKEIDDFKLQITNLVRNGKNIGIPQFGISGKVVGAGFSPYWTGRYDSKIEKLELNILNKSGRIIPFTFKYVVGFEKSQEESGLEDSRSIKYIDIHIFSSTKVREKDPYDKIRLEID